MSRFEVSHSDMPAITVLKEKRVVARTPHKCSICGGPIPPGSRYTYFFIRDDDSIPPRAFSSYQHIFCPIECDYE